MDTVAALVGSSRFGRGIYTTRCYSREWRTAQYINDRLRRQRVKWRREIETVDGYWKDCANEDREHMRAELRHQLTVLDADLEASNVDDFTKADLRARVGVLMKQVSDAHA